MLQLLGGDVDVDLGRERQLDSVGGDGVWGVERNCLQWGLLLSYDRVKASLVRVVPEGGVE